MVLIQELPERISTTITHKVLEVIYPNGDITDPITGKQVVGSNYRYLFTYRLLDIYIFRHQSQLFVDIVCNVH